MNFTVHWPPPIANSGTYHAINSTLWPQLAVTTSKTITMLSQTPKFVQP